MKWKERVETSVDYKFNYGGLYAHLGGPSDTPEPRRFFFGYESLNEKALF